MPYDPKPISQGGNRGIDEPDEGGFTRKAPKGKYRVVGVDTFDGGDWVDRDYKSLAQAKKVVDGHTKGAQMLKMLACHKRSATSTTLVAHASMVAAHSNY